MGKKPAASSAGSAALLPEHLRSGVFTSLSDITRKVIGDDEDLADELDDWTTSALQMAQRLKKKDEATRTRAISELRAHVESRKDPPPSIQFMKSFESIFRRTMINDPAAAVRRDALVIVSKLVQLHKKAVAKILKGLVPTWLAARGDQSVEVSTVAKSSFKEAFPSPSARSKALTFVQAESNKFLEDEMKANEDRRTARALAVANAYLDDRHSIEGLEESMPSVIRKAARSKKNDGLRRTAYQVARRWVEEGGPSGKIFLLAKESILDPLARSDSWELLLSVIKTFPRIVKEEHQQILPGVQSALKRTATSDDAEDVSAICLSMLPVLNILIESSPESGVAAMCILETLLDSSEKINTKSPRAGLLFETNCECCTLAVMQSQKGRLRDVDPTEHVLKSISSYLSLESGHTNMQSAGKAASMLYSAVASRDQVTTDASERFILILESNWSSEIVVVKRIIDRQEAFLNALLLRPERRRVGSLYIRQCTEALSHVLLRTETSDFVPKAIVCLEAISLAISKVELDGQAYQTARTMTQKFLLDGVQIEKVTPIAKTLLSGQELSEVANGASTKSLSTLLLNASFSGEWVDNLVLKALENDQWELVHNALAGKSVVVQSTMNKILVVLPDALGSNLETALLVIKRMEGNFNTKSSFDFCSRFLLHEYKNDRQGELAVDGVLQLVESLDDVEEKRSLLLTILSVAGDQIARPSIGKVIGYLIQKVFSSDSEGFRELVFPVVESNLEKDDFLSALVAECVTEVLRCPAVFALLAIRSSDRTKTLAVDLICEYSESDASMVADITAALDIFDDSSTEAFEHLLQRCLEKSGERISSDVAKSAFLREKSWTVVIQQIRACNIPLDEKELALNDFGLHFRKALSQLEVTDFQDWARIERMFSLAGALFPLGDQLVGADSCLILCRAIKDLRKLHISRQRLKVTTPEQNLQFDLLAALNVLAGCVMHANSQLDDDDVRFSVEIADRCLKQQSSEMKQALPLAEKLLRSSLVGGDDQDVLRMRTRNSLIYLNRDWSSTLAPVENAIQWTLENVIDEQSIAQLSYNVLLQQLRSCTGVVRSAVYRIILRKGPPAVSSSDESEVDDRKLPKEFADAIKSSSASDLESIIVWSLVLDLTFINSGISSSDGNSSSFRRAVTEFLRANDDILADFMKKCLELAIPMSDVGLRCSQNPCSAFRDALHAKELKVCLSPVSDESFDNLRYSISGGDISLVAARAIYLVLLRLPALSRRWFDHSDFDASSVNTIKSFVKKRISPQIIEFELGALRRFKKDLSEQKDDFDGDMKMSIRIIGREIWTVFSFTEVSMELTLLIPEAFPLLPVDVKGGGDMQISSAKRSHLILGVTKLLAVKDGTFAEAISFWQHNLKQVFDGVEECPICYSVLHLSSSQMPKVTCPQCKKKFHSACLYKWFTTSATSACPMCRARF